MIPISQINNFDSLDFLSQDPDLSLAIVFGSTATGKSRPDSDIAVAVYPKAPLNTWKRQQVADDIAMATGRPVDLIDMTTAEGALLRQILHTGVVLFSKEPGLFGTLLEQLLDWQEDFEPQLDQLFETRLRRFMTSPNGS